MKQSNYAKHKNIYYELKGLELENKKHIINGLVTN